MKVTYLIFVFIPQALAASFFDDLRGVVSNVERGFEKLITDVVTDVTDTLHCTLSAVEQVLVLKGVLDKTSAYNYRCRGLPQQTEPPFSFKTPLDKIKILNYPSHREFSTKHISATFESSKSNTTETIHNIFRQPIKLDKQKTKVLHEDTRRLAEISDLLKEEVAKLSNNLRMKIEDVQYIHKDSVKSLWSKIRTLHDIQSNSHNQSEINEIRNVLDKVVNKLDMHSDNYRATKNYDMDDIKKRLEKISTTNTNHKQIDDSLTQNFGAHDASNGGSTVNAVPKTFKEAAHQIINHNTAGRKKSNNNVGNSKKSVFNLDAVSLNYFTPFSSELSNKETIDNARTLIQESQRTDKVLNKFFQEHKTGVDVFNR